MTKWWCLEKKSVSMGKSRARGTHQDQDEDQRRTEEGERRRRRMLPEAEKRAKFGRFDWSKTIRFRGWLPQLLGRGMTAVE